jgi:D-glycero-D-manno-heptose 1,7-bisphosphate phosphatase
MRPDPPDRSKPIAFLDRDGVLNVKQPEGCYVTSPQQFELLPGAIGGLKLLACAGYRLIVVTNQRGVARGQLSLTGLEAIHSEMRRLLAEQGVALDGIYFCPHEKGTCDCRKPDPGLLRQAFRGFPDADPNKCVLIGDSVSDVEAARRAGVPALRMDANGSLEEIVRAWFDGRTLAK